MPPTDDAFTQRVLGRIQELRYDLEHLKDRSAARAFKAQLLDLHRESCVGDRLPADVAHILDVFVEGARATILKLYGTAAWDEPQSIAEALARRVPLPAAPGPGVLDRVKAREPFPLTDEELAALLPSDGALAWPTPAWATFSIAAGQECVFGCGGRAPRLGRERSGDEGHRSDCKFVRLVAEVRRLRTFLLELQGGLVGPPAAAAAWADVAQIVSDQEIVAYEAVVRAAIRWTDTGPKAKVMSSFDLIMAELRRLRAKA